MKGRIKDMGFGLQGDLTVTLTLPRQHADSLKKLMDCEIDAEIKKLGIPVSILKDFAEVMYLKPYEVMEENA